MTADRPVPDPEQLDELDEFIAERVNDPEFRAAFEDAQRRAAAALVDAPPTPQENK